MPTQSLLKSRPLQVNILIGVVGLLVITVLMILSYSYYQNSKAVLNLSDELIAQINRRVIEQTSNYLKPAVELAEMSSQIARTGGLSLHDRDQLESFTVSVLKSYPNFSRFYFGDERGNFLMAKRMPDGTIATNRIDRTGDSPSEHWYYRNAAGDIVDSSESDTVKYDPRTRPWYIGAKKTKARFWTDNYVFYSDKKPGISAAFPAFDVDGQFAGVFSLDIELSAISRFLKSQQVGQSGLVFIVNKKHEIIGFPDSRYTVKQEGNSFRPLHIRDLGIPAVTAAFENYKKVQSRRSVFELNGEMTISVFTPFPKSFGKSWMIVLIVPENEFIGLITRTNVEIIFMSLAILLIAILISSFLTRTITTPITLLTEEAKKIKNLELDGDFVVRSRTRELQLMGDAIASMKTGLRSFKRYVPAALVRQLINSGMQAHLGGQKKELTVMFTDIAGFTVISEAMSPEDLTRHLSEYLDELTKIIMSTKGTIDKYIGDSIMAFWGAPIDNQEHAYFACKAALHCQRKATALNEQWSKEGKVCFPTRMGISTGECIVGNMGSTERMNYTAIGDNVNIASRLERVNKVYGSSILVSQTTYEKVSDRFLFRPLDIVAVSETHQGLNVYELVSEKGVEISESDQAFCDAFTRGFSAYQERNWEEALNTFTQLREEYPNKSDVALYIERCLKFRENPPGPEWQGIGHTHSK